MIVDLILAHKATEAASRKPPRPGAYNIGRCPRMLWGLEHGWPTEPLQARALLTFDLGDRIEDAVVRFIREAGIVHIRTDQQADTVRPPELLGIGVRSDLVWEYDGSDMIPDDLEKRVCIPGNGDVPPQKGEMLGCEVKSMNNRGFSDALRGNIGDGYRAQVECNLRAYGLRWWIVLAYRKETSHICEVLVGRDDAIWRLCKENAIIAKKQSIPPDRPKKFALQFLCAEAATGKCVNGKTPKQGKPHSRCNGTSLEPGGPYIPNWECGYCPVKVHCWSDVGPLELVFDVDGKPRWRMQQQANEATA